MSARFTSRFAASAMIAVVWSPAALAAPTRVALVVPVQTDELFTEAATRLQAELEANGFEVIVVATDTNADARASVAARSLDPVPVATVAISNPGGNPVTDIWVSDHNTGKDRARHVEVADVEAARAPSVLAVRSVELLRATLLEAAPAAPQKPAPEPPPKPTDPHASKHSTHMPPETPSAAHARFTAALGASGLFALKDADLALGPMLRAGYGTESLSIRMTLVAPAFGASVSTPRGSAHARQEFGAAEITGSFPARGAAGLTASAGLGAYHLQVEGSAEAPYIAHSAGAWAALGLAGLGLRLRATERWGAALDVNAAFAAPRSTVVIAGVEASRIASPMLFATAGFWGAF